MAKPANANDALDPVCRLPQEVGPCRAYMKRWSYNLSKAECVEFNYGGCRGNANNFETKEACETKCGGKQFTPLRLFINLTYFRTSKRVSRHYGTILISS